jgi:hypothetical protein
MLVRNTDLFLNCTLNVPSMSHLHVRWSLHSPGGSSDLDRKIELTKEIIQFVLRPAWTLDYGRLVRHRRRPRATTRAPGASLCSCGLYLQSEAFSYKTTSLWRVLWALNPSAASQRFHAQMLALAERRGASAVAGRQRARARGMNETLCCLLATLSARVCVLPMTAAAGL